MFIPANSSDSGIIIKDGKSINIKTACMLLNEKDEAIKQLLKTIKTRQEVETRQEAETSQEGHMVLTCLLKDLITLVGLPKGSKILGATLEDGKPAISFLFLRKNYPDLESRRFLTIGKGHLFNETVIAYIGEVDTRYPTSRKPCGEIALEPIKHYIFEIKL